MGEVIREIPPQVRRGLWEKLYERFLDKRRRDTGDEEKIRPTHNEGKF
jgi:hypothetical protein